MSARLNFFFSEALRSLTTNLATSVAATLSMLVALLVVGTLLIIISFASGTAKTAAQEAGKVKVYLKETVSEEEVNALVKQAKDEPQMESWEYVSEEKALDRARNVTFKNDPEFLKNLPTNPFPASVELKLKDPTKVKSVAAHFDGEPGVDEVEIGGSDASKVINGATLLTTMLLILGVLLVIAGTFLVSNTIRLSIFARRREIEVMKLVGASNSFVRLPFMIEGFLCGLFAAVGAIVTIFVLKLLLNNATASLHLGDTNPAVSVPVIFLGLLGMGIALGGLGSGMTIRRYLRV
jgi:cell division transport system permease protein